MRSALLVITPEALAASVPLILGVRGGRYEYEGIKHVKGVAAKKKESQTQEITEVTLASQLFFRAFPSAKLKLQSPLSLSHFGACHMIDEPYFP
jgi:hypothetical protein